MSTIQSVTHFEGFGLDSYGAIIPIPNHNPRITGVESYWYVDGSELVVYTEGAVNEYAIIIEYTKV